MKYFLISNYSIANHRPEINQINRFRYKNAQIWSCALNEINWFIVNTYDFHEYIFYITSDEIEQIKPLLEKKKMKNIIIKNKIHWKEKQKILYTLKTDINLSVKVFFI